MMYKNTQQGFSLVETLVAITILLIVIVGPMSISSQSAKSTSFASEQVIAFFLAQEGAELVQKQRDNLFNQHFLPTNNGNYVASPWATFVNTSGYQSCYATNGCGIEVQRTANGDVAITGCTETHCPLYFDDAAGSALRSRYTHQNSGSYLNTPYSRSIKLERVSANEVRILSTVYWRSGNVRDEQSTTVETYLFNTYGE